LTSVDSCRWARPAQKWCRMTNSWSHGDSFLRGAWPDSGGLATLETTDSSDKTYPTVDSWGFSWAHART